MTLYFEATGPPAKTPVVLLRPIAGTVELWGEFRTELARHFRVIACEARGIGRSPPAAVPTTTRGMARDVAALLDELGVAGAHVFGLSLGGMVATWLAIERRDLVDRLVLGSTPPRGLELLGAARKGPSFAICLARRAGDREACLAERALSRTFKQRQPDRTEQILAEVRRERGSLRSLVLHGAAGAAHDARSRLGEITAGTLCIAGEHDPLVGPEPMRVLCEAIAGARLHVMPATGHDLSLEQPHALAALVAEFLRG
jgi:pimeloyl-ACP methyl ester carboxylesterase